MIAFFKRIFHRLFPRGGVYYVNGPDVLPAPLSHEEEHEALSRLPEDEEARASLIEHNLRLVVYIARRFENTGTGLEDLVSIGTVGLIKAINTFNAEKSIKLATYASRCIENEILMYIRKNSGQRCEVSIDEPLNVDWDGNELLLSDILGTDEDIIYRDMENEVERNLLMGAVNKLSEREKTIIKLYNDNLSEDGMIQVYYDMKRNGIWKRRNFYTNFDYNYYTVEGTFPPTRVWFINKTKDIDKIDNMQL